MLSRDCDGCSQQCRCRVRFALVVEGEFVYCPDGGRHLVDWASRAPVWRELGL